MPRPTRQARHLRKAATPAEKLLWSQLHNRRLGGFKFRRQHPIGTRIVDFYCEEKKLVVELDGDGHGRAGAARADAGRTGELQEHGVRVMRFWNSEVLSDLGSVLDAILYQLDPEKSRWPRPVVPSP